MDIINYLLYAAERNAVEDVAVVANNIANKNSSGFKKDLMLVNGAVYRDKKAPVTFPHYTRTESNFSNANIKKTNRELDFAIHGDGKDFFCVETPNGIRYTQSGVFHRRYDGVMVTSDDHVVLSVDGEYIMFDESDIGKIHADGKGALYVGNPGYRKGQMNVVRFEDLKSLHKHEGGLFESDVDPVLSPKATVKQGEIVESNVGDVEETVTLVNAQIDVKNFVTLHEGYINFLSRLYEKFV